MAETFGNTVKNGSSEHPHVKNYIFANKFESGSAGKLVSITIYLKYRDNPANVKCAIYDSSLNLLTNGITEEKVLTAGYDDWMTFDFLISPSVAASTDYWLCWWYGLNAVNDYYNQIAGSENQHLHDEKTFDTWRDPLEPDAYADRVYSIYATYEEAATKKTLVQVGLISAIPLITVPTLGQILKFAGVC